MSEDQLPAELSPSKAKRRYGLRRPLRNVAKLIVLGLFIRCSSHRRSVNFRNDREILSLLSGATKARGSFPSVELPPQLAVPRPRIRGEPRLGQMGTKCDPHNPIGPPQKINISVLCFVRAMLGFMRSAQFRCWGGEYQTQDRFGQAPFSDRKSGVGAPQPPRDSLLQIFAWSGAQRAGEAGVAAGRAGARPEKMSRLVARCRANKGRRGTVG
ncbi:MAG: hypothetical protein JWP03_2147 [Phycisphaerales bacterium]|nr:hypothetical protein [Phycisphaerales bacterium]